MSADLRDVPGLEAVAAPLGLVATGRLWDKVREGGGYGALCRRDPAGAVTFLSFRNAFASAAGFLRAQIHGR